MEDKDHDLVTLFVDCVEVHDVGHTSSVSRFGGFRNEKPNSQEKLDVNLQGGAGQGQLEAVDDVRVEDAETPDALPLDKDLRAAAGEESGVYRRRKGQDTQNILFIFSQLALIITPFHFLCSN